MTLQQQLTKNIYTLYAENVEPLTPARVDRLKCDEDEYGTAAVKDAIKEAVFRNKRSMGYIEAILRGRYERELKRRAHERAGG